MECLTADDDEALDEFITLRTRVYERWGNPLPGNMPDSARVLVRGETPFAQGRIFRPFLVRDGGQPLARAMAVVDQRYREHWKEKLGHVLMYEAMPGELEASRLVLDSAGEWLRGQGNTAMRAGFGPFEPGFLINEYEQHLPHFLRHSLPYYHAFLKDAGFACEGAACEYLIQPTTETVTTLRRRVDESLRAGFEIVPFGRVPPDRLIGDISETWNVCYAEHWGMAPLLPVEVELMLGAGAEVLHPGASALAYRDGRPVGIVLANAPAGGAEPAPAPARTRGSHAVGVAPEARGRRLAWGLSAHAFLEQLSAGLEQLVYGLVLDDNQASRRAALSLGAHAGASLVTYRRSLE
jgi:hypothetical protein